MKLQNTSIIFLILLNFILLIITQINKTNISNLKTQSLINEAELKNDIQQTINQNYIYENITFDTISPQVSCLLKKINKESKNIFFRIPFPFCKTCITMILQEMQSFKHSNIYSNFCILTSFPTNIEVDDFIKEFNIEKIRINNIPEIELSINRKELHGAYLFTLNNNLSPEHILFTTKINHYLLPAYISALENLILDITKTH